jgi:hypothetical protein
MAARLSNLFKRKKGSSVGDIEQNAAPEEPKPVERIGPPNPPCPMLTANIFSIICYGYVQVARRNYSWRCLLDWFSLLQMVEQADEAGRQASSGSGRLLCRLP